MNIIKADTLVQNIEPLLKKTSGITAFALAKNFRLLSNELQEFEKHKRELFEKYGYAEGDKLIIKPENVEKYQEEINIFKNEEINIELRYLTEEELIESGLNGQEMLLIGDLVK